MPKVIQYELREPAKIYAVLWRGSAADLVGMPEFDELVCSVISIDLRGMLKIELDGEQYEIATNLFYIVHESNRGFRLVLKDKFEKSYAPVPICMPKESAL